MTQARYIAPESVVMVTRQTLERRLLLKPTPWMRATFFYLLGWACRLSQVELVAAYCGSDHYQVILYDRLGRAPDFAQLFNGMMTRTLNTERGEAHTSVWDNRNVSICRLEDEETLLDKLASTAARPVDEGLVHRGKLWPGARTRPEQLGTVQDRLRPQARLFGKRSKMRQKEALKFVIPPMLEHWNKKALVEELNRRIEEKERAAREAMAELGREFLGAKKARAKTATLTPTQKEEERAPLPRFIASTKAGMRHARRRLRSFQALRRSALEGLRRGAESVVFPHGTFQVPAVMGVSVGLWPP